MDFLLEKYLHFFSSEELSTPTIESQLNKITEELRLKTRELSTPFTFMHGVWGGVESSLYLDSEIVLEALEKVSKSSPPTLSQLSTLSRGPSRCPRSRATRPHLSLVRLLDLVSTCPCMLPPQSKSRARCLVVRSSSQSGFHRRFRGLAVRSLLFTPLSCHSPSRRTSTRSFQSPPLPR